MPNPTWRIVYGDYDFAIDRASLTYRLTETQTSTVWADALSVGWIVLEERATGTQSRHDFAQATLVSVAEKSSHQGKRVLFGLDLLGIPIDLYFICSQREIQLTVEASRDTATHTVQEIGLLPGLASVPDDGASHLVLPMGEGIILQARDVPEKGRDLEVWGRGLRMPFMGAVRVRNSRSQSALSLITDSAYAAARRERTAAGAQLTWTYARDPERRRLDVRCMVVPHGDAIAIARVYRDKLIDERNHVTLKRKIRERTSVQQLIGAASISIPLRDMLHPRPSLQKVIEVVTGLQTDLRVENAVIGVDMTLGDSATANEEQSSNENSLYSKRDVIAVVENAGYASKLFGIASLLQGSHLEREKLKPQVWEDITLSASPLGTLNQPSSRWEDMEQRLELIKEFREYVPIFGSSWGHDWSAAVIDFWWGASVGNARRSTNSMAPPPVTAVVPLQSVIYHDSVISYSSLLQERRPQRFLRTLLTIEPPKYTVIVEGHLNADRAVQNYMRRTYAVLGPLHSLSFSSFLTEHRFLTADFLVEEAVYSDKTRVLINQSETEDFECDDIRLPPLGFYVRHAQMEAHDALRVGDATFATRAWRIRRALDGKPLETSNDIQSDEFPVS